MRMAGSLLKIFKPIIKINLLMIFILIIYIISSGIITNILPISQESDESPNTITQQKKPTTTSRAREPVNNSPPYFLVTEIPEVELVEDFISYTLNLSGFAADNEDPAMALRWFITGENKSIINITNENSTTQQLIFKSVLNAFGEDGVKLWVMDSTGLMAYQLMNIRILPKNDFPTISELPVLNVQRATPYVINLKPYIVDFDTPVSQIEIKIKPDDRDREFASIFQYNLRLDFTSTTDFNKNYITLELFDKINFSQVKIYLNLSNNYPPEQLKTIPDIILYKGNPLNQIIDLDYYFTDQDNEKESLTYEYFLGEHVSISINEDNTVDINSLDGWEGADQFIIRCMDPAGAFKEQIVNINITSKYLPVSLLPLPDLSVHYDFSIKFNLTPYIKSDKSKLDCNFEIFEFINNKWINYLDFKNIRFVECIYNIISINYSVEFINKTIPVFISISQNGVTSFQEFLIRVIDNHPPILKRSLPDQTLDEDQKNYTALDLFEFYTDVESGPLWFSSVSENVILDIKVNGLVDISITPDWFGTEIVIVRGHDVKDALVEDSFLVTVNPINDAPKILPIPQINISKGTVNTFEYMKYLNDVDNNISQLQIEVDNEYITVAGGFLIFDYPSDFKGDLEFTLSVNDGELSDSQVVSLSLTSPNASGTGEGNIIPTTLFIGVMVVLVIMIIFLLVIGSIYVIRLRSFRFDEVFLIYKDGLLIAHTSYAKKSTQDSDIISSMFTAVQDFIHDSFSDPERTPESWPLKRLDFGDFKIVIDRGEYIYIAAVFSGFPIRKMLLKVEKLRMKIEKEYADILPTWSGDMEQLEGTQKLIEGLLFSTGGSVKKAEGVEKKSKKMKMDSENGVKGDEENTKVK